VAPCELKACRVRRKKKTGSNIDHVPAIYGVKIKRLDEEIRTRIRTRLAHDGYARGDELVLHIPVDVVQ
jgi:hypothetical protein